MSQLSGQLVGRCFQKLMLIQLTLNNISNRLFESSIMSDTGSDTDYKRRNDRKSKHSSKKSRAEGKNSQASHRHTTKNAEKSSKKTLPAQQNPTSKEEKKDRVIRHVKLPHSDNANGNGLQYSYCIVGQTKMRHITQQQLTQRLNALSEAKVVTKDEVEETQKAPNEGQDEEIKHTRRHRYFDDFLKVQPNRKVTKCYRCGKNGHVSANCMQEKSKIKCYFCLQSHHFHSCESAVFCNDCGVADHIAYVINGIFQECRQQNVLKCDRCNNKGHLQADCGTIIFQKAGKKESSYHYREYDLSRVDESDLRSLRCLNDCSKPYRHFSCYKIDRSKEDPYTNTKEEICQFPEKDGESEAGYTTQISEY